MTGASIASESVSARLVRLVESTPGWSPPDELLALFGLAFASSHLPGDLLELGSWCGRSAVALGLAAVHVPGCLVHCIDLFPGKADWQRNADGTYSMSVMVDGMPTPGYHDQTVWPEAFERDIAPLYEQASSVRSIFDETIRREGLQAVVRAYRGTSAVVLRLASEGLRIRVGFIDGDHSFEAVCADIDRIAPILVPGGWLCFDDAFTSYSGVDRAIRERVIASGEFDHAAQLTRKMFVARKRP